MIRQARHEARITQAELALLAGTSQSALARYETGASLPTLPTLERLLLGAGRRLRLDVSDASEPASPTTSVRGQLGVAAAELRRKRPLLLRLARSQGVRDVRVFGSVARGDTTPTSDIDLLVELDADRTLVDLAAFRREAQELLGIPVDVATLDMLKPHIRKRALAEAIAL